ncbi:TRAM domain-containing protein [Nostocoides sp. F2B08]|uniref:class I SAM-dependent RNA methyltransferase n=1 Tax=Nostocoides sp. F2B08 TaxID=2653936 RepID=UPI0012636EFE|nr:TRAM domain-containing protein [Tetrasphaera sp. F2B08]KAB7742412.1 TRAM domain-containing protein [Tetrasphaera sp. F2B08]
MIGEVVELDVGAVAHGGHCVARLDGQVVFVRHALPGERVLARVTEGEPGRSFLRAHVVEVLRASPQRVEPPCRYAGVCGGCDFQHVALPEQRRLKQTVVLEQLRRLGGLEREDLPNEVVVEPVPGDRDGLGWRTRVEFAVDGDGRPGLRRHRSHEVVPLDRCLIASRGVTEADVTGRSWPDADSIDVTETSHGEVVVTVLPAQAERERRIVEHVSAEELELDLALDARGFWQVHPGAAATFVEAVLQMLEPRPGERAVDLYSGVGLFACALAERVGPLGQVVAVESDRAAVGHARSNLAEHRQALVVEGRVDDLLGVPRHERARRRPRRAPGRRRRPARSPLLPHTCDLVVLDPPRIGAGAEVVREVARLGARAVAYVACDPAALARDVATFREFGYALAGLRCFDAFPMTHHVETVALLAPVSRPTAD